VDRRQALEEDRAARRGGGASGSACRDAGGGGERRRTDEGQDQGGRGQAGVQARRGEAGGGQAGEDQARRLAPGPRQTLAMNGWAARPASPRARVAWVVVFAVAMAWLEAVVVVYIRAILGLAHADGMPPQDEVMRRFVERPWLLPTEQAREAATLVMLGAVGWLAAPAWPARIGAFLLAFGVWDIFYYVSLYALLRWPPSLATMDLLFLLPPGPWWYQPVWVPVAVSCVMIAAGGALLLRGAATGNPTPSRG
jgi:hypothetical protein